MKFRTVKIFLIEWGKFAPGKEDKNHWSGFTPRKADLEQTCKLTSRKAYLFSRKLAYLNKFHGWALTDKFVTSGIGLTMMLECRCQTKCCKLIEKYWCQTKLFTGIPASMVLVPLHVHGALICPCFMSMSMLYVLLHAGRQCLSLCSMSMSMLLVRVHSACPFPCCMSMCMVHVHVYVHGACPCPCCMCMSMLHVHAHAACVCPCYMCMSMLHVHVHDACACPCCMSISMLHIHIHDGCTYTCCKPISMLHVHSMSNIRVCVFVCLCMCICVCLCMCINAGLSGIQSVLLEWKKLMMPESNRYRTKLTQSSIFLVQYRIEIMDARLPQLASVSSMPMPIYD